MSEAPETGGKAGYRAAISAFLQERLQAKLDKLKPDDPQRDEVIASFAHDVWLACAAKRVEQIQAVTHSLKPIHADARGTNLYVEPRTLPPLAELGSHALGERFVGDVVGNAAALDVYKLLKLEVNGRSLLTALLAHDADALAALHADPAQAEKLRDAFVSLTQPRAEGPSSHTLAKQLYWLTGTDACDDSHYTLLAPLYATSLAHAVHAASVFDRLFIARPEVRRTVRALRVFLESDPDANLATREQREELLDALVDELVSLAAELQQILSPGWSRDDERFKELAYEEALWLDPLRAEIPEEAQFAHDWQYMDWPAAIGKAFAGWLNAQLRDKLPVGDAEAREWKKVLLTDEDGFKQHLRELRNKLDAPHYIPIRKTHAELVALREENP